MSLTVTRVLRWLAPALFVVAAVVMVLPTSVYIDLPPSGEAFISCGFPIAPSVYPVEGTAVEACAATNDRHQLVALGLVSVAAVVAWCVPRRRTA